MKNLI